jgi:hypothetical protein
MQRRQVFVVDVAKEGLLEAGGGQASTSRWRSQAPERSFLAVAGEGGRARNARGVRLPFTPQLGQ